MIVLAPGKAILCGEYAVLHGAPAVSVAVARAVRVRIGEAGQASPFVAAARAHAGAACRMAPPEVAVDSSALYAGAHKLGLGSSAAVTVGVCGAVFAHAGRPLEARTIFEVAEAAHAEAQGTRGSGVDVATAVWGGAIRFQRANDSVAVTPVALPRELALTFVWSGRSASTPALLARVRSLSPAALDAHMGRLYAEAEAFANALVNENVDANANAHALVDAADAYGRRMDELGRAAGVELVTPVHARLAELARAHGGAAKPSGAGGGDLGVAFSIGEEATVRLRAAIVAAGLEIVPLGAPAPGLRLETSDS